MQKQMKNNRLLVLAHTGHFHLKGMSLPSASCIAAYFSMAALVFAADPILYEPLDNAKPLTPAVQLETPTMFGPGKIGEAVLLESRTQNLLGDADLSQAGSPAWILMDGAEHPAGQLVIPTGAAVRQVVSDLKDSKFYCFSVYARSKTDKPARLSLGWDGAPTDGVREFAMTSEWTRIWVSGKLDQPGSSTVTIRGLEGVAQVERPQFEASGSVPTSYFVGDDSTPIRGVSGLVWRPGDGEFNPIQGTVSFWFKPDWAGETMNGGKTLLLIGGDEEKPFTERTSMIMLCAWLTDRDATDWQYGINLTISDRKGKRYGLTVPANDLTKDWHHLAIAWNLADKANGRVAIYIDGEQRSSSDGLQTDGMEDALKVAFGQGLGGYLDGWLDEVRIYKEELPAAEIQKLSKGKE